MDEPNAKSAHTGQTLAPAALRVVSVFRDLPELALQQVLARGRVHAYRRRQQLTLCPAMAQAAHFVLRGSVRVLALAANGRGIVMNDYAEGDVIGLSAALAPAPEPLCAQRFCFDGDTLLLTMAGVDFQALLSRYPGAYAGAFAALCAVHDQINTRFYEAMTLNVRGRLIAELTRLSARAGAPQATVAATHGELGERIRASREMVTRVLNDLEAEGVVRIQRGKIIIQDALKLQRLEARHAGRLRSAAAA